MHVDEEFLKEEIKVRERETLDTFALLHQKKKELLALVIQHWNQKTTMMDIALTEEIQELRKIVSNQEKKKEELRAEISKQGTLNGIEVWQGCTPTTRKSR